MLTRNNCSCAEQACTEALLFNSECDEECNSEACHFDNLECMEDADRFDDQEDPEDAMEDAMEDAEL